MGRRYLVGLVCEFGPPALGSDIPIARRFGRPPLRVRLGATERHGKRNPNTEQTATAIPHLRREYACDDDRLAIGDRSLSPRPFISNGIKRFLPQMTPLAK